MKINKSNSNFMQQISEDGSSDIPATSVNPEGQGKAQSADGENITYSEIFVFRSVLEKLTCVDQEDFTWTWDHETRTFLIQASNNIIEQYVNILRQEMGINLCLPLKRVSIIVDLRPWKSNSDKTSLRIGFEGNHIPVGLNGHTGLDDLVKLHFVSLPGDSPEIKEALNNFRIMCRRIDSVLERQYEWMWEKHWKKDGLAFAVVRSSTWLNKCALVEKEIGLFNSSKAQQQTGVHAELSTYHRGASFNVRIALDGLPDNLRKDTRVLDVFDTHFSHSTK